MLLAAAVIFACLADNCLAQSSSRAPASANSGVEIRPVKTIVSAENSNAQASNTDTSASDNGDAAGSEPKSVEGTKLLPRGTAAMDESGRTISSGGTTGTFRGILNTVVALAVVLGIIFVLSRLMKRWGVGGRNAYGGNIEVLARASVTHRHGIALVRIGSKVVAVGISPENINTLTEFSDPQQVAMLLGEAQKKRPDSISSSFASALDEEKMQDELAEAALEDINSNKTDSDDPAPSALDRIDTLLSRVRKLSARNSYGDGKGGKQ